MTGKKAGWQLTIMLLMAVVLGGLSNLVRSGNLVLQPGSFDPRFRFSGGDRPRLISFPEAEELFRSREALFLDARPAEEYDWGHIPGARNLPSDAFVDESGRVLLDISPDTPVVVYSDGVSCGRSARLALTLKRAGFRDVRVLLNGWTLWRESGLPTEIGSR